MTVHFFNGFWLLGVLPMGQEIFSVRFRSKLSCYVFNGDETPVGKTRDALLYVQLQEGLKYELMKAPAVSGVLDYPTLCVAAKSEE